jgi:broad specificity phosphatase PhoE
MRPISWWAAIEPARQRSAVNSPPFYFVRHGETEWNAERRLQGQLDVPLNDTGRRQSAQCADILRALIAARRRTPGDFTFLSSPLSRARETMEILRTGLGLPCAGYATDDRLRELSFGHWEGLTYKEVRVLDRSVLAVRERDKWNFTPPDGESYAQLLVRVREWQAAVTGDVIVTAHGGVARVLSVLFGVRPPEDATAGDIVQGVVYEFGPGVMHRHG